MEKLSLKSVLEVIKVGGMILLQAFLLTYFLAMFPFGVIEWIYAGY